MDFQSPLFCNDFPETGEMEDQLFIASANSDSSSAAIEALLDRLQDLFKDPTSLCSIQNTQPFHCLTPNL